MIGRRLQVTLAPTIWERLHERASQERRTGSNLAAVLLELALAERSATTATEQVK
jgi:hypothetical protein